MDHSETSTNSSASEPQMGQTKSAGSSSHSIVKTQLLQAYFFIGWLLWADSRCTDR